MNSQLMSIHTPWGGGRSTYELQTEINIHPVDLNKGIVFFPGKFIFAHFLKKIELVSRNAVFFPVPRKKLHLRLSKFKPFPEKTN